MAKRSRPTKDESSDYEDGGATDSDASFTPATKSSRGKRATTRTKPIKKRRTAPLMDDEMAEMARDLDSTARHPTSTHVITDPVPLRKALLAWYATVHEARGMPWRKPFDPSFGPEERAQRAYEVRSLRTPVLFISRVLILR